MCVCCFFKKGDKTTHQNEIRMVAFKPYSHNGNNKIDTRNEIKHSHLSDRSFQFTLFSFACLYFKANSPSIMAAFASCCLFTTPPLGILRLFVCPSRDLHHRNEKQTYWASSRAILSSCKNCAHTRHAIYIENTIEIMCTAGFGKENGESLEFDQLVISVLDCWQGFLTMRLCHSFGSSIHGFGAAFIKPRVRCSEIISFSHLLHLSFSLSMFVTLNIKVNWRKSDWFCFFYLFCYAIYWLHWQGHPD